MQQLAKQGVIPKGRRGEYHLVESVRGYIRFLRSTGGEPVATGALGVEQVRRMRAEAGIKEIELKRLTGEMVAVEDVVRETGELLDGLRSNLLAFTSKHAHELVGCKTIADVTARLQPAVHELMSVLAGEGEG